MKKLLALCLALILALSVLSACATEEVAAAGGPTNAGAGPQDDPPSGVGEQPLVTPRSDAEPTGADEPARQLPGAGTDDNADEPKPDEPPAVDGVTTAPSYEALYDTLEAASLLRGYGGDKTTITGDAVAEAPEMEEMESAASDDVMTESGSSDSDAGGVNSDYSDTNTQVEGVDEADVVKTDGEYIYALHDSERLTILRADGTNSEQLASVTVCRREENQEEDGWTNEYASDLYLAGDRLVVLYDHYSWGVDPISEAYYDQTHQGARIYDVSDPSNPTLVSDVAQDGWLTDSRLIGNVLYLLTNYHVYNGTERDDPATYIPRTYCDGEMALVAVDCIFLPEPIESTSYLVVQAVDVQTGEQLSEVAVLGGGSYIYMNTSNLYVADRQYADEAGEPYTEDVYTVTEHYEYQTTRLLRFAVNGGVVTLEASGTVSGYPLNQYSFDEYDGCLRMVVTESDSSYRIYEDEKRGWINYEWLDSGTTNGLYVLDASLQVVGEIRGLAEDERVYSARFDGPVGYFVTFRETDPLYAVDLSDPTAPTVMSALKIPGFSSYLHLWDDGLLFGLGQMADEETGMTEGLKLAMYDTSDPYDVTELLTLPVGADYSPAESNPRAMLIDPEKNLIGFACESYENRENEVFYVAYRYVDGAFVEFGRWALSDWVYDTRGLYIGDTLYIVAETELVVVSLETGAELFRLALQ